MTARPSAGPPAADGELVITRLFDAPRRLVFAAWTEPERLMQWWGPRGFTTPSCELDPRPGGVWRVRMRPPTGADLWVRGTYREIVEPERLVFTSAWEDAAGNPGRETLVTVTFADRGEQTLLTFRQAVFETVESRDDHEDSWSSAFEMLAEYLASARAEVRPNKERSDDR